MPPPINFYRLGYSVKHKRASVTQAARNNAAFYLNPYIVNGKYISPTKASHLYDRCYSVLNRLTKATGIKPNRFKLHIVEEGVPNLWIFRESGDICITTGFLSRKGLTEGELAAALSHELGHYLKSKPRKLPKRFKNPLFRDYARGTEFAKRQYEEFEGDELGLLIMDRAGYSVDEALNLAEWMAKVYLESGKSNGNGTKVLNPFSTHPDWTTRTSNIRSILAHPKFVWLSREVKSKELFDRKAIRQLFTEKLREWNEAIFRVSISEPLSTDMLDYFAQHSFFEEGHLIYDLFIFLESNLPEYDKIPRSKLKALATHLKHRSKKGDVVAKGYLQALLANTYFKAAGKNKAVAELKWLKDECGINNEEVLMALLAFMNSMESVFPQRGKLDLLHFFDDGYANYHKYFKSKLRFKKAIQPFPRSELRDQFIAQLLRAPFFLEDQLDYIEHHENAYPRLPFEVEATLIKERIKALLGDLHGTSVIDISSFTSLFSLARIDDMDHETANIFESIKSHLGSGASRLNLDYTQSNKLTYLSAYIVGTNGPFSRAELESLLAESISVFHAYDQGASEGIGYHDMQRDLLSFLLFLYKFKGDRVAKFSRIFFLRFLESIPVKYWEEEIIQLVEHLPRSSEKNHLLILLHKEGKRKLDEKELLLEEVPRPDEISAYGESMTLLNSFGFADPFAAEAVYPSGQRVLDAWKAESLPKEGPLSPHQIKKVIPRPSPKRDELLDRCRARTLKQAQAVLAAYWSPAAAFAKAYQISRSWMEGKGAEDPKVFEAIIKITNEFPSLKRRMVREWTDRFGITKERYQKLLDARSEVDALDVYKGGIVEHGRKSSLRAKTATALASFASALSRDKFSLLSLQEIDVSRSETEEFEIRVAEITSIRAEKIILTKDFFRDYSAFLPENAEVIARILDEGRLFSAHRVPFVDGKPLPNQRFERKGIASNALSEMKKWDGAKLFSDFMQAMGWEEAVSFYEDLFFGKEGIMNRPDIMDKLEDLFLKGIGLLLQEKKVPLSRIQTIEKGMKTLLAKQDREMRARIWARILAGIAQQLPIGEITREAVRPLKTAGGKLMQAIHSLTAGVDATLEEATRLALDQTASFSLFDGLQYLSFRFPESIFDNHSKYTLLGQGTVRAAIGGIEGPKPDEAFLLVHATPTKPAITNGLVGFIRQTAQEGYYFPLTVNQFRELVIQAEGERTQGFTNHIRYGGLYNWKLGQVSIPRVIEHNGDWARIELVAGVPYTALEEKKRKDVAEKVIEAAFAQFGKQTPEGEYLINPEFHAGNLLIDAKGNIYLVDCGLIGESEPKDLLSFFSVLGAFRKEGLPGAAAALFMEKKMRSLNKFDTAKREALLESLKTMEGQIQAGTSPELLLPALSSVVENAGGPRPTTGTETLFRALQHLAPYIRAVGKTPAQFSAMLPPTQPSPLASELKKALSKGETDQTLNILPRGLAVGRKLRDGRINTIGALKEEVDLTADSPIPGTVRCPVEGVTQYVKPEDLVIQKGDSWIALAEFKKK